MTLMGQKIIGTIAAVAIAAPASAAAVHPLGLDRAQRAANHVRHREQHNAFGLRARIGGPFKLTAASCDPNPATPRRMVCSYIATGVNETSPGMRERCSVDVAVRLHGLRRVTWRRHVDVCVEQVWGAP